MKTIFITGASTGLGKATAKLFASNGWKVIATMRNAENDKALHVINNICRAQFAHSPRFHQKLSIGKKYQKLWFLLLCGQ